MGKKSGGTSTNWNKGGVRPEHSLKADEYYGAGVAKGYNKSQRVTQIQKELSQRAIDLLDLPDNQSMYLLDVGCGSGMSGEQISRAGHVWVGYDISSSMLGLAMEDSTDGDLLLHDAGQPLRRGGQHGEHRQRCTQCGAGAHRSLVLALAQGVPLAPPLVSPSLLTT